LAPGFCAVAAKNRSLRISAGRGRAVGSFELGGIRVLDMGGRDGGGLIIIVDGSVFVVAGLGNQLLKQVLVILVFVETIKHYHDLFLLLHGLAPFFLHRRID
jgi:hypothetical protein